MVEGGGETLIVGQSSAIRKRLTDNRNDVIGVAGHGLRLVHLPVVHHHLRAAAVHLSGGGLHSSSVVFHNLASQHCEI